MKKFIYIGLFIASSLFVITSCSTEDKLIDQLFDTVERGAVLRTIAVTNPTFDFLDTSKSWSVNLEIQDEKNGSLVSEIKVYATLVDDGTVGSENLVKTISTSSFSIGPYGFPRGDVSLSLQETIDALGLSVGDYDSADSFNIRLVAVLTDGREYTNDAGGTVTGGSFFSSPFAYSAQFFCALADASNFDGNYVVTVDAWADYSPGEVVPVQFVSGYTFRILSTNNPFINNPNTSYMEVTIDPTDGSVTLTSNECFDYGGGFCTDVIGTGSVGTCTGDINVVLNFTLCCPNQTFSLVKL
jgi:hypothetical protein